MSEPSNLYRWNRITEPRRTYSRSQRVTSTDDVKDWLKTVEQASDNAAAATFGAKYGAKGQGQGHRQAKVTLDMVHQHDAAYAEAQDLLKEWVSDKLNFDDDDIDEDFVDVERHASKVKQEWDSLLDLEDYGIDDDGTLRALKHKVNAADVYTAAEAHDEQDIVDDILQHMMDKDVVTETVMNDLGLSDDKGRTDPSLKMKLRHEQVKQNREKRNKVREERLRDQQRKKEAQVKAKQILLKEEREKSMRKKQEEEEIQKEMARIRKALYEEKKKQEEMQKKQKKLHEEDEKKLAEDIANEKRELESYRETQLREAERKRRQERIAQNVRSKQRKHNYKVLHHHFLAWYDVIRQRRLQIGKAQAMADWRRTLRAWNAWRAYTRNRSAEKEALEHEYYIKTYHRKILLADNKYRETLLRKTFIAWQLWLQLEADNRKDTQSQEATRSKMAAFLQAAATGQLWQKSEHDDGLATDRSKPSRRNTKNHTLSSVRTDRTTDSARDIVNDMFAANKKTRDMDGSQKLTPLILTERSDLTEPESDDLPTQPWQITKKHLKLTSEQIASLSHKGAAPSPDSSSSQSQRRVRKKAWEKSPPTPNNFEHRHSAQQKILMEQQKQIREQQRLIEDLQFVQKQQALTQTIAQQQIIQEELKKMAEDTLRNAQQEISNQHHLVSKIGSTEKISDVTTPLSCSDITSSRSAVLSEVTTTRGQAGASARSSDRDSKHQRFVRSMEERAAERARIKQEREDRKRKIEEQKMLQLQAEEEERRTKEEEERKREREAYREKKRLEKQRELEKQHWDARLKELTSKANAHYNVSVLRQRGWKPWRRLIEIKHEKLQQAEDHYENTLIRKCLTSWHLHARAVTDEKEKVADKMREYLLIQRCFHSWKKCGQYMLIQEEKAARHYRRTLLVKLVRNWADYATTEQIAGWEKERRAKDHSTWRIKRNAFHIWKHFPQERKLEEEREKRREEMRKKVASMLPDFQGFSLS